MGRVRRNDAGEAGQKVNRNGKPRWARGLRFHLDRPGLVSLVVGKPLIRPVRGEILREQKHTKILEPQALQRLEGRPDVWAALQRAAPAINHQIRGAGKSGGPRSQFFQAFFASRRTVVLSAPDVPGTVEPLESHE